MTSSAMEEKLHFLEKVLGKAKYSTSTHEAMFFSPFVSHHKPKLSINLQTDFWRCFISGKAGKKLAYVLKQAKADKATIREYLETFTAEELEPINKQELAAFSIKLPPEYVPLTDVKKSLLGSRFWDLLVNERGLSEVDILRYKIGIATSGQFANRMIFPSFNKYGRLNLFTTRSLDGNYLLPETPRGYRNSIIINELSVDWTKPIVLVEGFLDMVKSIHNSIPLFGSTLFEDSVLFEKIITNDAEIYLALDADAEHKTAKIAKDLSGYNVKVSIVPIAPYHDIGEMSKEKFVENYNMAKIWTPEAAIFDKIKRL